MYTQDLKDNSTSVYKRIKAFLDQEYVHLHNTTTSSYVSASKHNNPSTPLRLSESVCNIEVDSNTSMNLEFPKETINNTSIPTSTSNNKPLSLT